LFFCKWSGNRFFAFRHTPNEEDAWEFTEYDLSVISVRKIDEWSFSEALPFYVFNDNLNYVLLDNKVYVALRCVYGFGFSVVSFDIDTSTWAAMKFIGAGHIEELAIDDDHILTINAFEHYRTKEKFEF